MISEQNPSTSTLHNRFIKVVNSSRVYWLISAEIGELCFLFFILIGLPKGERSRIGKQKAQKESKEEGSDTVNGRVTYQSNAHFVCVRRHLFIC